MLPSELSFALGLQPSLTQTPDYTFGFDEVLSGKPLNTLLDKDEEATPNRCVLSLIL